MPELTGYGNRVLSAWYLAPQEVVLEPEPDEDLEEEEYLEDKIQFPFHVQCLASAPTSPLRKGDSVEIRKMAPEDSCSSDMLVMTLWNNRNIAVPLSRLRTIDVDGSTTQAIQDWHYWVSQGNSF